MRALPILSAAVLAGAGCGGATTTVSVTTTQTATTTETVTRTVAPPPLVYLPQPDGRLVYMPDSLGLGVSNHIDRIRWKTYGGPTAIATAVFPTNDCTPSCAEGTIKLVKVTLKARERIPCHGVLAYEFYAVEGPGFDGEYEQFPVESPC